MAKKSPNIPLMLLKALAGAANGILAEHGDLQVSKSFRGFTACTIGILLLNTSLQLLRRKA